MQLPQLENSTFPFDYLNRYVASHHTDWDGSEVRGKLQTMQVLLFF